MKKLIPFLLMTLLAFSNLVDAALHSSITPLGNQISQECECIEDNCSDCQKPQDDHQEDRKEKKCDHCNHIHSCSIFLINNSVSLTHEIPVKSFSHFKLTENFVPKNYSNLLYRPPII